MSEEVKGIPPVFWLLITSEPDHFCDLGLLQREFRGSGAFNYLGAHLIVRPGET